jgi:hypothetical protein
VRYGKKIERLKFVIISVSIYKELQRDILLLPTPRIAVNAYYTYISNPFPTSISYAPNSKKMDIVDSSTV